MMEVKESKIFGRERGIRPSEASKNSPHAICEHAMRQSKFQRMIKEENQKLSSAQREAMLKSWKDMLRSLHEEVEYVAQDSMLWNLWTGVKSLLSYAESLRKRVWEALKKCFAAISSWMSEKVRSAVEAMIEEIVNCVFMSLTDGNPESAKSMYKWFTNNKLTLGLLFAAFIAAIGVLFGFGKALLQEAMKYLLPNVAQDNMTSSIGIVITMVSVVFGTMAVRRSNLMAHLQHVATTMLTLPKNLSLAGAIVSLMPEVMRLSLVGLFGSSEQKMETEAMLWVRRANEILAYGNTPDYFSEKSLVVALEDIVSQGADLTAPMLKSKRISPILVQTQSKALAALAQAKACFNRGVSRPRPFFIHSYGSTHAGKTYVREHWIYEEWAAQKLNEMGLTPNPFTWNVSSPDDFLSGFNHSVNVFMADELFPDAQIEKLTATCADLMCMVSSACYHPACPAITASACGMKGDTFYPRFMFTSSNIPVPNRTQTSLADYEPLAARFSRVLYFENIPGVRIEIETYKRAQQLNEDYWKYIRIKPGFINKLGEFTSFWPKEKYITSKTELFSVLDIWYAKYFEIEGSKEWPKVPDVREMTSGYKIEDLRVKFNSLRTEDVEDEVMIEDETESSDDEEMEEVATTSNPVVQGSVHEMPLDNAEIVVDPPPLPLHPPPTPPSSPHYVAQSKVLDEDGDSILQLDDNEEFNPPPPTEEAPRFPGEDICTEAFMKRMLSDLPYFLEAAQRGRVLTELPVFQFEKQSFKAFLRAHPDFFNKEYKLADLAATIFSTQQDRAFTAFLRLSGPDVTNDTHNSYRRAFRVLVNFDGSKMPSVRVMDILSRLLSSYEPTQFEAALASLCLCEALSPTHILIGGAVLGGFVIVFFAVRAIIKAMTKKDHFVAHSWDAPMRQKYSRNQNATFEAIPDNSMQTAQGEAVESALEFGNHKLKGYTIDGNKFVTYAHGLAMHSAGEQCTYHFRGKEYQIKLTDKKIRQKQPTGDIAMAALPVHSEDGKPIEQAKLGVPGIFATDIEVAGLSKRNSYTRDGSLRHSGEGVHVVGKEFCYDNVNNGAELVINDYIETHIPSKYGDCGLLYYTTCNGEEKAVAMHVAGPSEPFPGARSIGCTISRELLLAMIASLNGRAAGHDNLLLMEDVPKEEHVHLPRKTKYKKSPVFDEFDMKLEPAILSKNDPRANGQDPVDNAIAEMREEKTVELDEALMTHCFEEIYNRCSKLLIPTHPVSLMTAIRGDGGFVESTATDTSSGWPFVLENKSRKDLLPHADDGMPYPSEDLVDAVNDVRGMLKNGEGKALATAPWLLYLKDETVRPTKIQECRTRVIACGPLAYFLVWKQLYGHFFGQMNKLGPGQPYAIGMNPNSRDMQHIYNYLREVGPVGFVAGDYKGFDRHYQYPFLMRAYEMLGRLYRDNSSDPFGIECWSTFVATQVKAPLQIADKRFYLGVNHNSGCILTTILNCVVNEAYIRYAFYLLNPSKEFDKHVRCVVMGDDHVIAPDSEVDFNFNHIKSTMVKLGQTYTSDRKDEVETPDFRPFEEITFLGSHPIKTTEGWVGRLKKSAIEKAICWMTSMSGFVQTIPCVYRYASLWEEEYYNKLKEVLQNYVEPEDTYELYRSKQIRSSAWPPTLVAHSTLTKFAGPDVGTTNVVSSSKFSQLESCEDPQMSVSTGPDSFVLRQTYSWPSSASRGNLLFSYNCPGDVLKLYPNGRPSNLQNMQNMPFERFVLWRGDQEWKIQVNGTPMHQGLLAMYWMPMSTNTNIRNVTAASHVLVAPNASSSTTLGAMYQYPRTYLNTFAFDSPVQPPLGQLHLIVLVPLSSPNGAPVTVSLYSRFPNSEFHLPRPVAVAQMDMIAGAAGAIFNTLGALPEEKKLSNTLGNVFPPLRLLGALGLDAPARASGSMPVAPQYPGMSRVVGERQCVGLQMNPSAVYTHSEGYFNTGENTLAFLASRPCIYRWDDWKTTDIEGKEIFSCPLNSILGNYDSNKYDTDFPLSLSVANMFQFWHGDYVFEFRVVKTPFHSGRLRFIIAYGGVEGLDTSTVYFNQILNFDAAESVAQVKVPWNAVTEFLRSYDGAGVSSALTDYGLGFAKLEVCNVLTTSLTLTTVTIQTSVWMDPTSVKFAVPKALPIVGFADATFKIGPPPVNRSSEVRPVDQEGLYGEPEKMKIHYVAQGEEIGSGSIAENATELQTVPVTADTTDELTPPESIVQRHKFEYMPQTVEECLRRFQARNTLDAVLRHPFITCYSGWCGSLIMRLITQDGTESRVTCYQAPPYSSGQPAGYDLNTLSFGSLDRVTTTNPIEMLAAMRRGDNQWIDVMLPFQSHLGFHKTYAGVGPGREECQTVYCSTKPKHIFIAAGDDYRIGVFHPPTQCVLGFDGTTSTATTATGAGLSLLWS